MEKAILLALAASFCTATASVCQRHGAKSSEVTGFDVWLVFRLGRQPTWLLGTASMILGFVFQIRALRFGPLALVQPVLALELLFVFAYMAVIRRRVNMPVKVRRRDWLAAVAMSAGIGVFLRLASPSGGRLHAPGSWWWLAGLATAGIVLLALVLAFRLGSRPGTSRSRKAALLGAATGISWGFVAAVIKELSSHLGDGIGAIFANWSPWVLIVVGAATMLLASHALAAGPLAASQPGFTILDPLSASLVGVFLFSEHIQARIWDLAGEAAALAIVIAGVSALSHSHLIAGEDGISPRPSSGYLPHSHGQRPTDDRSTSNVDLRSEQSPLKLTVRMVQIDFSGCYRTSVPDSRDVAHDVKPAGRRDDPVDKPFDAPASQ
jgi:drug/metabolite transporter (DMT)-like permease